MSQIIRCDCPQCGKSCRFKSDYAGDVGVCGNCRSEFRIEQRPSSGGDAPRPLLRPCPACNTSVSLSAPTCPHCGHPLASAPRESQPEPARRGWVKSLASFAGALLLIIAVRVAIMEGAKRGAFGGPIRPNPRAVAVGGDAELTRQLVGAWRGARPGGAGQRVTLVEGTTAFFPNQEMASVGTVTIDGRKVVVTLAGTWRVEDRKLIMKGLQSNLPGAPPLDDEVEEILELTDTAMRTKDRDGVVDTSTRVGQGPGEPKTPAAALDLERFIGKWNESGTLARHEFFRDGTVHSVSPLTNLTSKWWVLDDGRIKIDQQNPLGGSSFLWGLLSQPTAVILFHYSFNGNDQVTLTYEDNANLRTAYIRQK